MRTRRYSRRSVLRGGAIATLWAGIAHAAPARRVDAIAVQRSLAGKWVGDGTTLVIDTERLQVNMDPEKPFDWRSFQLVNVTGRMVVFDVGRMRYVALLSDPTTMTLTSPSFVGQRALHRVQR